MLVGWHRRGWHEATVLLLFPRIRVGWTPPCRDLLHWICANLLHIYSSTAELGLCSGPVPAVP